MQFSVVGPSSCSCMTQNYQYLRINSIKCISAPMDFDALRTAINKSCLSERRARVNKAVIYWSSEREKCESDSHVSTSEINFTRPHGS